MRNASKLAPYRDAIIERLQAGESARSLARKYNTSHKSICRIGAGKWDSLESKRRANFKGGVHQSDKGYRRVSSGPNRHKYEHRIVMEEMLADPIGFVFYPPEARVPDWATTHHNDANRQHNCQGNLMLLQQCIHNAISRASQRYFMEHYAEWMEMRNRQTTDSVSEQTAIDREEVPF